MKNQLMLAAGLLAFVHGASHADTWTIRADRWCPYNCESKGDQGYMVEILNIAAKSAGHTLDYRVAPWPRALNDANEGDITGVVGVSQREGRGMILTDKMGVDSMCFFVNEGDPFKYKSLADLDKLRSVGTTLGVFYTDEFAAWQKANPVKNAEMVGDNTLVINTKKLKDHRIPALIDNASVVSYNQHLNPELNGIESAGCLKDQDLYVGISAKAPNAAGIVKTINAKLAELTKTGELTTILAKYMVKPW